MGRRVLRTGLAEATACFLSLQAGLEGHPPRANQSKTGARSSCCAGGRVCPTWECKKARQVRSTVGRVCYLKSYAGDCRMPLPIAATDARAPKDALCRRVASNYFKSTQQYELSVPSGKAS